jgi:cobalt-zinc-cadmium efflux system outer membrane protein
VKTSFFFLAFCLCTGMHALAQTPVPPFSTGQLEPVQRAPQTPLNLSVPLTLERVLARFLERNLAVEAARYRADSARADQIGARLRPNPSLLLTAENFKVQGNSPFTVLFTRLYEFDPSYYQQIEMGGKRRLRMEVADLGVASAEAEFADELRQRLVEVKQAFYTATLARQALDLALEQRSYFDDLVKFNQTRLEEGAIAGSELLKVKLERVKFVSAIAQAQLAVRQAGIMLLELLGETNLETPVRVAGELGSAPLAMELAALKQKALGNRPDLQAAERNVTLAERRIALEKARGVPDITPFAGYKRVGVDNTVQFGVTIPLRFNNKNQGEIARAVADEKVAATEVLLARNRVLAEVESAYRAYETAREQVETFQRELLAQADEARDLAQFAYREGATDLLPLLEAQRTRTEIRQQYQRALFDYQVAFCCSKPPSEEKSNPESAARKRNQSRKRLCALVAHCAAGADRGVADRLRLLAARRTATGRSRACRRCFDRHGEVPDGTAMARQNDAGESGKQSGHAPHSRHRAHDFRRAASGDGRAARRRIDRGQRRAAPRPARSAWANHRFVAPDADRVGSRANRRRQCATASGKHAPRSRTPHAGRKDQRRQSRVG